MAAMLHKLLAVVLLAAHTGIASGPPKPPGAGEASYDYVSAFTRYTSEHRTATDHCR